MRLINPKRMALDAHDGRIGSVEFAVYCAVFGGLLLMAALTVAGIPGFWSMYEYSSGTYQMIDALLFVGGALAMLTFGYTANKRGDGKEFWYRYISISIPITLIILILSFLFGIVVAVAGVPAFTGAYGYADAVIELLASILVTYLVWKYMGVAAIGAELTTKQPA